MSIEPLDLTGFFYMISACYHTAVTSSSAAYREACRMMADLILQRVSIQFYRLASIESLDLTGVFHMISACYHTAVTSSSAAYREACKMMSDLILQRASIQFYRLMSIEPLDLTGVFHMISDCYHTAVTSSSAAYREACKMMADLILQWVSIQFYRLASIEPLDLTEI